MNAANYPACPTCGYALAEAEVELGVGVGAANDPEGIARIELLLTCCACESMFDAFVPVTDLHDLVAGGLQ